MTKPLPLLAAIALTLPVPASALEPSPAATLAGRVAGPSRSCLAPFERDRESESFASGDILYRGGGGPWFLNHPQGCPEFRDQMALVTTSPTGQLCRGDIVRVVDPVSHFFYGACTLGDFVPYEKPKQK